MRSTISPIQKSRKSKQIKCCPSSASVSSAIGSNKVLVELLVYQFLNFLFFMNHQLCLFSPSSWQPITTFATFLTDESFDCIAFISSGFTNCWSTADTKTLLGTQKRLEMVNSNLFCQLVDLHFPAFTSFACMCPPKWKVSPKRGLQLVWIWNKRLETPNNGHYHNNANFKEMESSGKDTRQRLLSLRAIIRRLWCFEYNLVARYVSVD